MSTRRRKGSISDQEIIDKLREGDKPYTTAKRLAEKFPISRQAMGARLRALAEEGEIERDKVGGGGVIYLLSEDSEN